MSKLVQALAFVSLMASSAWAETVTTLQPTAVQSATVKDVVKMLATRHYRNLPIDDQLSEAFLQKYLESLDASRMYFLQSDISSFNRFSKQFDDDIKSGNLENGFAIYRVLKQRMESRLEAVIKQLSDPQRKYDFASQEEIEIEREKSPWPKNAQEADLIWDQRIRLSILNQKLSGKTTEKAVDTLLRRYKNQLKRVQQQNSEDVFETYINSLTLLYDPHTNYFSPRTSENFNISMSLSLEGIGAVLQSEDENTKVVRLVVGGPAARQGQLKPGDKIVGVGQGKDSEITDVIGWRLDEVVDLIRGKKNTQVKLDVQSSEGQNKQILITRDTVKLEDQAAQKAVFDVQDGGNTYKVGVIHIPTFYIDFKAAREGNPNYTSTTRDVARLIGELQKENVSGIVLDLRNNGGGSLQEATQLTGLFIDPGLVVQIREANGQVHRENRSYADALYRGPLVVLINRLSASASEIFAGAIQDYKRGLVVGSQSFGKGTVQLLSKLPEGELKLTESKFYRVSGGSTQHRGIIPDLALPNQIDNDEVGESTYDTALPWDQIRPASHESYYDFSKILPIVQERHRQRAAVKPDFVFMEEQIKLANELKNKKLVSLNEKVRELEKTELETKSMLLENKRRKIKGEPEYKTLADFRTAQKAEEDKAEADQALAHGKIETQKDALLQETGAILVDFAKLLKEQQQKQVANF
jgi:carboxyl-terminal processing protease